MNTTTATTGPEKDPAAVALGRKGGTAGRGKVKQRTREQAQAAARARWAKLTDPNEPEAPS